MPKLVNAKMKDSGEEAGSGSENVYTRLKPDTLHRLNVRVAEMGLRRPAVIAQAIESWLNGTGTVPAFKSEKFSVKSHSQGEINKLVAAAMKLTETAEELLRIAATGGATKGAAKHGPGSADQDDEDIKKGVDGLGILAEEIRRFLERTPTPQKDRRQA